MDKNNKRTPKSRTCNKCKRTADLKNSVVCSACSLTYHFDCEGYPEKLYSLMEPQKKESWKCKLCIRKNKLPNKSPKPITPTSNITLRKNNMTSNKPGPSNKNTPREEACLHSDTKFEEGHSRTSLSVPAEVNKTEEVRVSVGSNSPTDDNSTSRKFSITIPTENSFEMLSEEEDLQDSSRISEAHFDMNRSFPELRMNKSYVLDEMKQTIDALKDKLESADQEIQNLLAENSTLSKRLAESELRIDQLTHICKSTSKKQYKKKLNCNSAVSTNNLDFSTDAEEQRQNSSASNMKNTQRLSIQAKHCSDDANLHQLKHTSPPTDTGSQCRAPLDGVSIGGDKSIKKNRICMLSTNIYNPLYKLADQVLGSEYYICHYLYPNVRAQHLLHNIEAKLTDLTKDDYCMIFIGEEDFNETQNYAQLIRTIRNRLKNLTHTNVIVCSPTFKLDNYSKMYNSRLETFNYLLYNDNCEHEYAYLLDSNRSLSYDYSMFRYGSGRVSNYGIKSILYDISTYIMIIEAENKMIISPTSFTCNSSSPKFFRQ